MERKTISVTIFFTRELYKEVEKLREIYSEILHKEVSLSQFVQEFLRKYLNNFTKELVDLATEEVVLDELEKRIKERKTKLKKIKEKLLENEK